MPQTYILAIDQGTTGTTSLLIDTQGKIFAKAYREITQIYPYPGWVEHDPQQIWDSVLDSCSELMDAASGRGRIAAVGVTNQRETTIVWHRGSGRPLGNAIVWQCRRSADACYKLKSKEAVFKQKTGLPVDAYFSGTKLQWILDHHPEYDPAELCFGTVDSWIVWNLTGGKVHATDFTNASRTLMYNITDKKWDVELCRMLGVPQQMLPEVKRSMDDFGTVESIPSLSGVPICGVAGDQQAALFGQTCFDAGGAKNTYGTGCFLLLNSGEKCIHSQNGLLTTLAVNAKGDPCFALEGAIFIGGAALQWLRDELEILKDTAESQAAAEKLADNGGVYMVPAFVGLGAPHWDMQARGLITGLTRGSNRNHLIRAALESMAFQTRDVLTVMQHEAGVSMDRLSVDGGAAANDFLMQFQADILDKPVSRPSELESTSLGAAYLAGLGSGFWKSPEKLTRIRTGGRIFTPAMDKQTRDKLCAGWEKALRQAKTH
jgi:glycerol kinase